MMTTINYSNVNANNANQLHQQSAGSKVVYGTVSWTHTTVAAATDVTSVTAQQAITATTMVNR